MKKNIGHFSKPEIRVLALWTYGIILAKNCGLSRVAATLACNLGEKEGNLRQRLREWYWDKGDKQGKQRSEWKVQKCFVPLLQWVIAQWPKEERRLVLAMDATSLKQVFVVLSISVVYRGCAIPVAWAILPEGKKGSWKEPWINLFQCLKDSIPSDWVVLVMADRGLYAHWLYEAICQNQWHPFLRINMGGMYSPKGISEFRKMSQLLPEPGNVWTGQVTCFRHNSVEGTLLACWGFKHVEPWLILTDLAPDHSYATWYGMRCWIESSFKDLKRDGWQWHRTRMNNPARAERLWLALAIATFWVVSVGGEADASLPASSLEDLPPNHIARKNKKAVSNLKRQLSCFTRGCIEVLNMFINHNPISIGLFYPEPWPLKTYP